MGEINFPAWDPVLLHVYGPFDLRWYGLMYVVAFVAGQIILSRLTRSRFLPIQKARVGDLIFLLVLGVILGGRLGYCLFYKPETFKEPLEVLKIWKGGLSFHGGLLGVVMVLIYFAYRNRFPAWRLCDCLALAVTPGIFAVRVANFINGELYGRITDESVPWAMRFPSDPEATRILGLEGLSIRERELKVLEAFGDGSCEKVKHAVPLRHPSQIYEALAEGLLTGLVLWIAYRLTRHRPLGTGVYGGLFLLCYGAFRFNIEWFRQPDEHLGKVLWKFSMGQILCAGMILFGLGMIWLRRKCHYTGAPA